MIKRMHRFLTILAVQAVLAVLLVLLFSGAVPANVLMKVNEWGAKGKAAIKDTAAQVGERLAHPFCNEVGEVDWSQGVARATGYGVMPAKAESHAQGQLLAQDAAQMDAERNLVATLSGLKLKAQRQAESHAVEGYRVEESVQAMLKGARVVDVRYRPDGSVEVDVETSIRRKG